jgi:uncharacterized protein (DUF58 family)
LSIEVRNAVEGLQGGTHRSLHIGPSIEFSEHNRYAPGDDLRSVDWKAVARTDRFFVKAHEREAQVACHMLLDCSGSMNYRGTRARYGKLEFAKILLGAMGHLLIRQGDAAGLTAFAGSRVDHLPPRNNPGHLQVFMEHLARVEATSNTVTNYDAPLNRAANQLRQRGLIVLASDLWGSTTETEVALAGLAARRHDIVLFHILSPDEVDLPFEGNMSFQGLENEGRIVAEPALVREDYRQAVAEQRDAWRKVAQKAGIDLVSAVTSMTPAAVLAEFALRRKRQQVGR